MTVSETKQANIEEKKKYTRALLQELVKRFQKYAEYSDDDLSCIELELHESRPLEPLYKNTGGKHVGFIQDGPQILYVALSDFSGDGLLFSSSEKSVD